MVPIFIQKELATVKDEIQKIVSELNEENFERKFRVLLILFQKYRETVFWYEPAKRKSLRGQK